MLEESVWVFCAWEGDVTQFFLYTKTLQKLHRLEKNLEKPANFAMTK